MTISLPPLPYKLDALAPYISQETLEYHHHKHHQAYVDNLNALIAQTPYANQSLEEIIGNAPAGPIFNNAAQIWNHTFYFDAFGSVQAFSDFASMPSDTFLAAIESQWGGFAEFQEAFSKEAIANFGSGWTWLAITPDHILEIVNTSNAATLATNVELLPLLVCDVWEHAYYIDYRNARAKYLEQFWKVVHWGVIQSRFLRAYA